MTGNVQKLALNNLYATVFNDRRCQEAVPEILMQHKYPIFILTPFTCNRNQYFPFPLSAPEIPDRCVPKGKTYWLCISLLLWGCTIWKEQFSIWHDYFIFPRTDPTRYTDVIGSYKSNVNTCLSQHSFVERPPNLSVYSTVFFPRKVPSAFWWTSNG